VNNKLMKLKKNTQEDTTLWLSYETAAVADSFMLYLERDFYNIFLKSNKSYIASESAPPQRKNAGCAPATSRG
jgi:hypothetical protein